ncbi:MAG: hypothetical protein IPK19_08945 [Chloroflexi bacterium]|nr:hypothetical protein [Chloroflexota bacterium]
MHSYWSSQSDKQSFVRFMALHYPGVPLWMSEWTEMQQGRDYGMDSALVMANVIHDDLTIGGVTSWQYWIAVSKYNFRDGLIYTREFGESIEETKRLWTLGNFSRFVRPGAVRVEVETGSEVVRASAYLEPESDNLTVVVINNSVEPQSIAFEGLPAGHAFVAIYETSEANDLALERCGSAADIPALAPSSITTFVFQTTPGT